MTLLCIFSTAPVFAAEKTTPPEKTNAELSHTETGDERNWYFSITFGYGERSNPLINADNIKIVADIDIAWYGEKWFFDNGDLGYTLYDGNSTLNTVARVNSDRVFFSKTNTQYVRLGTVGIDGSLGEPIVPTVPDDANFNDYSDLEIPDRDYAVELGLEWINSGRWGNLQADFYHDVSGKHKGWQSSIDYSYPLQKDRWLIEPNIGVTYQSANLNQYYWSFNEVDELRYNSDAGTNIRARLLIQYQISKNWVWASVYETERLASAIHASPIVSEKHLNAWYTGFRYRF